MLFNYLYSILYIILVTRLLNIEQYLLLQYIVKNIL